MASAAVDQDDGSAVPTIELGDGRVSPGTRRRIEQSRAQGEGGGSGVVAVTTSSVDEAPATAAEQQSLAEDEQEAASSSGGGYTAEHLAAVMKPVTITMLLASWIVVNIREPAQDAAIASGLSVYMVFDETPDQSSSTKFGQAIINALVIVAVICVVTFILVLCYYYRCVKLMIGYLIFASASLLGYSGGFVALTALEVYQIRIDWPSFVFLMYNFAIVGVVAVFWQKGVPRFVTQGYLIAVSCIMAWIVVKLPEWTSWVLLVALALYDLCAVLTPCGPLKALVKLAQARPEQPIPGLLYEAEVGTGHEGRLRDTFAGSGSRSKASDQSRPAERAAAPLMSPRSESTAEGEAEQGEGQGTAVPMGRAATRSTRAMSASTRAALPGGVNDEDEEAGEGEALVGDVEAQAHAAASSPGVPPVPYNEEGLGATNGAGNSAAAASSRSIGSVKAGPAGDSYVALAEEDDEDDAGPRSIRLGLGDFVFYSVLVSRAALFGLATLTACFVAVIMGLVGTLLLLGIFKKALPALPISIALGVIFYFTTRLILFPMVVALVTKGVSV